MAESTTPAVPPWRIALAGMVALAVAMGIGRFAFTPLLPMMLADGVIDLATSSWLASANYLGYLVGALLCTFQPWVWRRLGWRLAVNGPALVRLGLVVTVVVTLGMAVHLPVAWPLLRFVAGVASAVVFVYTSGWCLNWLAQLQVPSMGALIYVGPGAGIVVSGLAASGMVQLHGSAATGWLTFGLLAALLTALVWRSFGANTAPPVAVVSRPAVASDGAPAPAHGTAEIATLALAYALAGLGYIVSATFLPVIARQAIGHSRWLDLFWPIFGLGIIAGALVASRIRSASDLRLRLLVCYLLQALGITIGLLAPSSAGFALGSLLVGMPMTAISFFAMQEVRRLAPQHTASLMGLLTAVYGLGQIAGPPMVAVVLTRSPSVDAGFSLSLVIATATLLFGAGLYAAMLRLFPMRTA